MCLCRQIYVTNEGTDLHETPVEEGESSIWNKPLESKEEKSKEEEYEDYFADLLQ